MDDSLRLFGLVEHVASLDCLEHGPQVIPVGFSEAEAVFEGSPVESFGFGNCLRTLGKDFG
jgi:hypothetical protein